LKKELSNLTPDLQNVNQVIIFSLLITTLDTPIHTQQSNLSINNHLNLTTLEGFFALKIKRIFYFRSLVVSLRPTLFCFFVVKAQKNRIQFDPVLNKRRLPTDKRKDNLETPNDYFVNLNCSTSQQTLEVVSTSSRVRGVRAERYIKCGPLF
jgi:hypothetical protein